MAQFVGTVGDDSIVGTSSDDYIYGGYYYSGSGRDKLYGGSGNDTIYGGSNSDTIVGGADNDWLEGGSGNDVYEFSGNFGQDYISWEYYDSNVVRFTDLASSQVAFELDDGDLFITKNGSADRVAIESWEYYSSYFKLIFTDGEANPFNRAGTNGNDVIVASSAGETLSALGGNDRIYGGGGNDSVFGGDGNDRTHGDEGNDRVYGGNQNDFATGGNGNDTVYGGDGNDKVHGNNGTDTLDGGNGVDTLEGVTGQDYLYGGASGDRLTGGLDTDYMYGGASGDTFVFDDGDSGLGAARDRILDFVFAQGDRIDLSAIDAKTSTSADDAFTWKGAAALTGAGQLGYYVSGGVTIIRGSTDADSAAEFEIQLTAGLTPSSTWFIM
ncbi:MAG: calcium-binding protein [Geminicoccaceae bacterium]